MQNAIETKTIKGLNDMNWGKSILLAFVLFAAFVATLLMICARQEVNLVTKDYYREELVYQAQIDRIVHTSMLKVKPFIEIEGGLLKVSYADFERLQEGALVLFRPSDHRQDKVFSLSGAAASTVRYFSTEGMQKGMYRAKMKWIMDGQEFFLEQQITL